MKLSVVKNKMCAKLGLCVLSFLLLMASSEDTDSLHDWSACGLGPILSQ